MAAGILLMAIARGVLMAGPRRALWNKSNWPATRPCRFRQRVFREPGNPIPVIVWATVHRLTLNMCAFDLIMTEVGPRLIKISRAGSGLHSMTL